MITPQRTRIIAASILSAGIVAGTAFASKTLLARPDVSVPTTPPAAAPAAPRVVQNDSTYGPNLTNQLVQSYAEKIAERNKDGLVTNQGKTGISLPDKEALSALIVDQLKSGFTIPIIDAKEVRTITDTSPEAARTYLAAIIERSNTRFPNGVPTDVVAVGEWLTNKNASKLFATLDSLDAFIGDLKTMQVPSPWVEFHTEFTNLHITRAAVYRAIVAMDNDPLQASLAAEFLGQLDTAETALNEKLTAQLATISR